MGFPRYTLDSIKTSTDFQETEKWPELLAWDSKPRFCLRWGGESCFIGSLDLLHAREGPQDKPYVVKHEKDRPDKQDINREAL